MRFDPDQLVRFVRLTDEWLDIPAGGRGRWLADRRRDHPDLSPALLAMAQESGSDQSKRIDTHMQPWIGGGADLRGMEDEAEPHRMGDIVGPYRLISLLGRGGMGAVWLAEQIDGRLSRKVALKLPHLEFARRDLRRRFERERDILAGLDHPGIAKLFDAGVAAEGQPYMAMQHVVGESIIQYANSRKLSARARVALFAQLLDAVGHAHSALVVHRDLKPSNILVDEHGRVALLDFGIAKLMGVGAPDRSGNLTEFAAPALTPDYASPEQVAGRAMGAGTDIYSLGVVLYELLAGRLPYRLRRASRAEMEEAVLEQELIPPSARLKAGHAEAMGLGPKSAARQLRGDLDAILLKALRKESDRRYGTAQGFADDLSRWLRKEPVSARPDSLGYRARRLLARRWRWAAIGVAVSAALIGSTAIAVVQARDARRSSDLARAEARQAEAVTSFMQNLFLSNSVNQKDPEAGRKRTAEQLMDDAAARIGTSLADAPTQQIALLHRMAQTYAEMRLPDRAIALSRQAAELAERVYGPNHLRTKFEQASWLLRSATGGHGEAFDERLRPLLSSLPLLAASPLEDERQVALDLCDALMNREFEMRAESAMAYAKLAEPILSRFGGGISALGHHHMMGVVYLQNLRLPEAAKHFDIAGSLQAIKGDAARDSDSYPTWRGRLYEATGRYAEAESMMREGYAMERRNDAGADRVSDWCLANYSRYLVDTGRAAEGLALAETGGPLATPIIRLRLATSIRSLLAQSHALARLGRGEEALSKAEQAERALRAQEAADSLPPLPQITESLLALGRVADAVKILDREEPRMAQGRSSMAGRLLSEHRIRALIAMGKGREARAYLESHRAILLPEGGGAADTARLSWLEGGVALLEGHPVEARKALIDGLRGVELAGSGNERYLAEWKSRLQGRMGDAELAMGDDSRARSSYESAMRGYEKTVDSRYSMALGRVARQLAGLASRRGDASSALILQAQADKIAARHPGQRGREA